MLGKLRPPERKGPFDIETFESRARIFVVSEDCCHQEGLDGHEQRGTPDRDPNAAMRANEPVRGEVVCDVIEIIHETEARRQFNVRFHWPLSSVRRSIARSAATRTTIT